MKEDRRRCFVPLAAIVAVAVVVASSASAAAQADRDRLGVRLEGRDGAVRRPGARGGEGPRRAGQRAGRRQGPAAEDRHVRHAGQQAGDREGVRREAARPGRRHHLHDLRRRLRRSRRAGVDQRGQAHGRAVHRHRPDGPEALRRRRASSRSRSATSPRTKARRWRSTPTAKGWKTAALATDTVIVYFKDVVKAFKARFTQLGGKIVGRGELPVARQHEPAERGHAAERKQGRRDRDGDRRRVRRTRRRSSPGSARSATTRRCSTRGPVTARTGSRRIRR